MKITVRLVKETKIALSGFSEFQIQSVVEWRRGGRRDTWRERKTFAYRQCPENMSQGKFSTSLDVSIFTAFLSPSNYNKAFLRRDIYSYIVRCAIKRTQRNCSKRLVKSVWFMTTFYYSLKLIFTRTDDICLQLIRSDGKGFSLMKQFSVHGS